jgi:hypothetical protein
MKSLPETELWKKIKTRLGKYEEEPDDQWDEILAGLNNTRQPDSTGMAWSFRVMLVLLVAYLLIPNDKSSSWSFRAMTSNLRASSPDQVSQSNPANGNQGDIYSLPNEEVRTIEGPREPLAVRGNGGKPGAVASKEFRKILSGRNE